MKNKTIRLNNSKIIIIKIRTKIRKDNSRIHKCRLINKMFQII